MDDRTLPAGKPAGFVGLQVFPSLGSAPEGGRSKRWGNWFERRVPRGGPHGMDAAAAPWLKSAPRLRSAPRLKSAQRLGRVSRSRLTVLDHGSLSR